MITTPELIQNESDAVSNFPVLSTLCDKIPKTQDVDVGAKTASVVHFGYSARRSEMLFGRPLHCFTQLIRALRLRGALWGLLWGLLVQIGTFQHISNHVATSTEPIENPGVAGFLSRNQLVAKNVIFDFQDRLFQPLTHPSA